VNFDAIPTALRGETRFVVARPEIRDGRTTKVPYCAIEISRKASSTDPSTWSDFDTARRVVESGQMPMLGYMLQGSGNFGIDLDHCRDPQTGVIAHRLPPFALIRMSYRLSRFGGAGAAGVGFGGAGVILTSS
jgi:primase-polymerase (primpol)-like protein